MMSRTGRIIGIVLLLVLGVVLHFSHQNFFCFCMGLENA